MQLGRTRSYEPLKVISVSNLAETKIGDTSIYKYVDVVRYIAGIFYIMSFAKVGAQTLLGKNPSIHKIELQTFNAPFDIFLLSIGICVLFVIALHNDKTYFCSAIGMTGYSIYKVIKVFNGYIEEPKNIVADKDDTIWLILQYASHNFTAILDTILVFLFCKLYLKLRKQKKLEAEAEKLEREMYAGNEKAKED